MASYFRESRNIELSVIYYLETSIASDWTGVTVVKRFQDAYKSALPVVAIGLSQTANNRLEIGDTALLNSYTISIDIFAKSDGQRLDFADYIVDKLRQGCVYYTHSQTPGAPDTLTRSNVGRIHVTYFSGNYKVDLGDEGVDTYDKFRHYIEVSVRKT